MNPIQALENYTRVFAERELLIAANKPIFDQYEAIGMRIIDADNALRDAVAEAKQGVQNDKFVVTVTPQTQTWADIEEIDKLIDGGVIPKAKRDQIVKTQERPVKISIRAQSI